MKKSQIITLLACVCGASVLLGASLALYRGITRFNRVNAELNTARQQLYGFYQADVFPSGENVEREQANIAQLDAWFAVLAEALRAGNVSSSDRSPSRFVGIFERARERLLREAQASRVELTAPRDRFAFGFDRYTGTGALPNPDDVPRLTEQLVLINRVCRILFENRISTLRVVEREVFEQDDDLSAMPREPRPATESAPMRRTAARRQAVAEEPSRERARAPGVIPENTLYGKYRFAFEFDAREGALIGILNALAASPAFSVTMSVRLAKEVPLLMSASLLPPSEIGIPRSLAEFGIALPAVEKKEETTAIRLGPNHPVSGIEMEIPMRVRLEVDVFKFKGESNESGV